jgi:hypothetical protein
MFHVTQRMCVQKLHPAATLEEENTQMQVEIHAGLPTHEAHWHAENAASFLYAT